MKKIALLLLLFCGIISAQNSRQEKIKAIKTAFITERLDLSSKEAEKFWPIYNAYEDKLNGLRRSERREIRVMMSDGVNNLSDGEANDILDKLINLKIKDLSYYQELIQELKAAISPKKILLLKRAEEDFKKRLLERLKNRPNNRN